MFLDALAVDRACAGDYRASQGYLVRDHLRLNQRNKYQAHWEFAHGLARVATTPPVLQIARNNICNFRCVYCTDHREGNDVPRHQNEGATWQLLLTLIPRSSTLSFHGISEFMIDPEFFDTVERCAQAGAELFINTNGSVCGERYLDVLGSYPWYLSMNFSLDAATSRTFLHIRGASFDKVMRNIRRYMERFESRRDRTFVTLSYVITRSNVKELTTFVRLVADLKANGLKLYRLHEYDGLDWKIPTRDGGVFDYKTETTMAFADEYNREVEAARKLGEELGLYMEMPGLLTDPELTAAACKC